MDFLFNSRGVHIANFVDDHLYLPSGQNIGHYLRQQKIFVDMEGNYLGEIIHENRLVYNYNSPYISMNYGIFGDYGNIGDYGNPGNYGSIGLYSDYKDIVFK